MSSPAHTVRLGTDPIGRLLIRLSLPGMVSMLIMTLYNLTDTFWVAKLGPRAIAALTVVFPYQMLLVAIGVGTGVGLASLISRRLGAHRIKETNNIAGQIYPLSVGFGLLFCSLVLLYPDTLLLWLGTTPEIHSLSKEYFTLIGFGAPFVFYSMMSSNCLRGSGNTLLPMVFMIIGALLNIILDPLLIFGIGFFPEWGVRGAAAATLFSQSVAALAALLYQHSRYSGFHIRWLDLQPRLRHLIDIYRVSLPSFIMQMTASLMLVVMNRLLGFYGSEVIAANGIIFRINGLIIMPIFGISQGLMPVVGYNYGAGNLSRLWRAVRWASWGSVALIGLGTAALQFFPSFWINLFTRNTSFQPLATLAIHSALPLMPLIGPPLMWFTTFQALGQAHRALIISLTRQLLLQLPCMWILSRCWGAAGVWAAIPFSDLGAFVLTALWIANEHARQKRGYPHTPPTDAVRPADLPILERLD